MAANFTELLDKDRLRPLWGTASKASAEAAEGSPKPAPGPDSLDPPSGEAATSQRPDDAQGLDKDAPPEPQPPETPTQILAKIERLLYILLGPQAVMLGIYMHPLRKVLSALEGHPLPPHPLQSAIRTGNLSMLIYGLEDSYRGILRAKQRLGR